MSQNNIRNNQNFEICTTICRPGSTTTIKSKAEPGGSTLSRSIFAFLENRDNTNVDSNPTKTSMNLKNLAQGNFSNWPNASPSRQASSDTWRPHQTERGTVGGTCEEPVVHLEGVLPPVVQQLSLNDHDQHDQHDGVVGRQRVSPRPLHCFPRLPSPPCCPSIIRIFSPHLLDTCMNEEIDK